MNNPAIQAIGVARMPEIAQGDDIGSRIIEALRTGEITIVDRDVLIVAQKIVSKAEGRTVQRVIRTFNLFDFFQGSYQ